MANCCNLFLTNMRLFADRVGDVDEDTEVDEDEEDDMTGLNRFVGQPNDDMDWLNSSNWSMVLSDLLSVVVVVSDKWPLVDDVVVTSLLFDSSTIVENRLDANCACIASSWLSISWLFDLVLFSADLSTI